MIMTSSEGSHCCILGHFISDAKGSHEVNDSDLPMTAHFVVYTSLFNVHETNSHNLDGLLHNRVSILDLLSPFHCDLTVQGDFALMHSCHII